MSNGWGAVPNPRMTTVLDRARRQLGVAPSRPEPTSYKRSLAELAIWEQAKAKARPVEWRSAVRPGDWHVLWIALAGVGGLAALAFAAALFAGYRAFPWG